MAKIHIKSPTRVDLAGGTLDMWPLFTFVGGASTINVAIDIWTEAEIETREDSKIILESADLNLKKEYTDLKEALAERDPKLSLLQIQLQYWKPEGGFHLKTRSQSPVGGGLGGSSSLTISLMKAFLKLTGQKPMDPVSMVQVAHNLEAGQLRTPTGTQDYFPAVTGGLNVIHYSADGINHQSYKIDPELEKHFLLVNTGKSHHSGLNNFEVLTNAVAGKKETMDALWDLKQIALDTEAACLGGKWNRLTELFQKEYQARIRLAPAFSSPEIEKLGKAALRSGASAVKICGAGGGGCVLVYCDPDVKGRVAVICKQEGFQVLPARPVNLS
ncbi:MAG: galactokinase [Pseudobdellovibrionaceae bacterium]